MMISRRFVSITLFIDVLKNFVFVKFLGISSFWTLIVYQSMNFLYCKRSSGGYLSKYLPLMVVRIRVSASNQQKNLDILRTNCKIWDDNQSFLWLNKFSNFSFLLGFSIGLRSQQLLTSVSKCLHFRTLVLFGYLSVYWPLHSHFAFIWSWKILSKVWFDMG